jgi:hypothetical protein
MVHGLEMPEIERAGKGFLLQLTGLCRAISVLLFACAIALRNTICMPPQSGLDTATLAAIDQGVNAADEGRTGSLEEALKIIPKWTSRFESQTRP